MLKPGNFLCKVLAPSNGWFGEAGSNNTPFIRLPLEVIESGDCEGEQITYQGWLTDKSLDRTIKNLADIFGWNGDLEALAKQLNTGPFVGKECRIVTEEEEYNGKKSIKIKWLNGPDSAGGSTLAPESALAIAKRFAARAKAAATGEATPAATAPAPRLPRPAPDPDLDAAPDDIPF